jgi:hypothetical protein
MRRILDFLSSLRLTVALLSLAIVLVFLGTLAQVHEGTWTAQKMYFQSWYVLKPTLYNRQWPIILPGGYLVGTVLLVNLILAHFRGANWSQRNVSQVLVHHGILLALVFVATWFAVRNPFIGMGAFVVLLAADLWISRNGTLKNTYTGKKLGINFTHVGVVMLLLGQLATDQLAEESHLSFREGEARQYSEVFLKNELTFIKDLGADQEEVVSIPQSLVEKRGEIRHEKLPFVVRVKEYAPNCSMRQRGPMVDTDPPPATQGEGQNLHVEPRPETKSNEERNTPYAVIELSRGGTNLGSWLVAVGYLRDQEIDLGDQKWRVAFRPERRYTPYTVQLLKTTHEIYPGTDIPRNFQSRVRIENPKTGENRETDIYMNNPLRYAGLTFYQYQMGRDEMNASVGTSTLQVVKNPSWLTPYFGCGAVGYGLARHFLFYLIGFIVKRRTA